MENTPTISATKSPAQTVSQNLEDTPEFKAWKKSKIDEWVAYLQNNWNLKVSAENLVLMDEQGGWPDPERRQTAHKIVGSNLFFKFPGSTEIAINPATGKRAAYVMYRDITKN